MDGLRGILNLYSKISDQEWTELLHLLREETLTKKTFYVNAGKICSKIGFLQSGFCRAYYENNNGIEKVVYFNFKERNPVVSDFESFISEKASKLNIQAVTDCKIISIKRSDLYMLYEKCPSIERLGRVLAEKHYLDALERIRSFQTDAINRYFLIQDKYPELIKNVPANMIASYLDITESSLSRIKREIYKKSKKLPYDNR